MNTEQPAPRWPRVLKASWIFWILFFFYAYLHQEEGWNQNSRLDLLHSIWFHQTFRIDAYHANTGDKSEFEGHFYSDKPPGIVMLALPAFAASALAAGAVEIDTQAGVGWDIVDWLTTVGSVGLLTALGGAVFFRVLSRLMDASLAFLSALFVFLGAAPFPYATMLFSHSAVIGLICIALWGIGPDLAQPSGVGDRRSVWRLLLAGLCCGFAIASEYTAAIPAGGVLLIAAWQNWRRGALICAGALPPLLMLIAYNWICFRSPLTTGYSYVALEEFVDMKEGFFGITFPPRLDAAWLILFSEERGLFFWTPFFLLVFAGIRAFWKWSRLIAATSWGVVLLEVMAISGYYMPDGGAALGPRLLAPMVPFMGLAAAVGFSRLPRVGFLLGFGSLVLTGFGTFVAGMAPEGLHRGLSLLYLGRLLSGNLQRTWLGQLGFGGWLPLLPFGVFLGLLVWEGRAIVRPVARPIARGQRRKGKKIRRVR